VLCFSCSSFRIVCWKTTCAGRPFAGRVPVDRGERGGVERHPYLDLELLDESPYLQKLMRESSACVRQCVAIDSGSQEASFPGDLPSIQFPSEGRILGGGPSVNGWKVLGKNLFRKFVGSDDHKGTSVREPGHGVGQRFIVQDVHQPFRKDLLLVDAGRVGFGFLSNCLWNRDMCLCRLRVLCLRMRRLFLELENTSRGTTSRELGQGGGRFHEMGQSLRMRGLCWNAHGGVLLETQLVMKEG